MGVVVFRNSVLAHKPINQNKEEINIVDEDKSKDKAVDFTLTDQYGESHTLSQYKGKTVFINFWATWCPPCKSELPDIQKLYEEKSEDVVVLGITAPGFGRERDEEGIKSFLDKNRYTYPVLMDENVKVFEDYKVRAYPTTIIVDKDGNIKDELTGPMSFNLMKELVEDE